MEAEIRRQRGRSPQLERHMEYIWEVIRRIYMTSDYVKELFIEGPSGFAPGDVVVQVET